ncbi:MAG: spermine synthase [Thiothrix sp.]
MTVSENTSAWYQPEPSATLLERRQTDWQLVEIFQHPDYGNQLVIDHDLQISEADFAYNTAMTAPLLAVPECQEVAILGGGDGGVMNELLAAYDRLEKSLGQVTLIDIDGDVIDLCRQYLPRCCGTAFEDPRSEVIVGDAFGWLEQARGLDAVIYDLTMDPVREGISRSEFMQDIFGKIHDSLRPGGVVSLQACGEWQPDRRQLLEELRSNLDERFDAPLEQVVMVPSYGEMWTFLAARKPPA